MRIIIDQDEVLAQFVNSVLNKWNKENGTNFTRDQIDMWKMEELLGPGSYGKIEEWLSEPGFFENLEPIPGAIDGFNMLIEDNHDVIVVTALDKKVVNGYDGKRAWMKKYFPNFPTKNIIACSRKECIDADVIVDDGLHNIRAWNDAGKYNAIIFDAPWNRNDADIKRKVRAYNWTDVRYIIEKIAEERHERQMRAYYGTYS